MTKAARVKAQLGPSHEGRVVWHGFYWRNGAWQIVENTYGPIIYTERHYALDAARLVASTTH